MDEHFSECVRQHLDFIQSNIARMNSCSFQMKGWAGTIVSALLAVYAATNPSSESSMILFLCSGAISLVAFALLDAYYLKLERQFREIYNNIINPKDDSSKVPLYSMPLKEHAGGKCSLLRTLFSASVIIFYVPLLLSYSAVVYFAFIS